MNKWYIMAASSWMRKPSVEKIIQENGHEGVITVATIGGRKVFILGAGNAAYGEVGSTPQYIYDTGNGHRNPRYGEQLVVQNSIIINQDRVLDSGNGIGLDEKRSLYVFK
jgi:hypothetical protein